MGCGVGGKRSVVQRRRDSNSRPRHSRPRHSRPSNSRPMRSRLLRARSRMKTSSTTTTVVGTCLLVLVRTSGQGWMGCGWVLQVDRVRPPAHAVRALVGCVMHVCVFLGLSLTLVSACGPRCTCCDLVVCGRAPWAWRPFFAHTHVTK